MQEVQFIDDNAGRFYMFSVEGQLPPDIVGAMEFVNNAGQYAKGRSPFIADDSRFLTIAAIDNEQTAKFYLPNGAVDNPTSENLDIVFTLLQINSSNQKIFTLASTLFTVYISAPPRLDKVEWLRPLISMCMTVVHADGRVMPEEIRIVKDYLSTVFEFDNIDLRNLKDAMKAPLFVDINELASKVMHRLPNKDPFDMLQLLADISKCDGEIHPKEVEVIRELAVAMGMNPSIWSEVQSTLDLFPDGGTGRSEGVGDVSYASVVGACEVLNVNVEVSKGEMMAAYRRLASDYHPDRVASLPKEFQEVAHQKMTDINAAYDILKKL